MNRYKSNLDKEKSKKRELEESVDYFKEVDKSAEGGRKFVVDKIKEEEKKEKDIKDAVASYMQSHQGTYHQQLASYGQKGLEKLDWPDGWERYCLATDGRDIRIYGKWFRTKLGIQVIVKDDRGNVYTRGVLTTKDPIVDMANVDTLVVQAENTIDSAKGLLLSEKKTKGGIYLPN